MKFTTTFALASIVSAVLVAATPIPSDYDVEIDARDFADDEIIFPRMRQAFKKAAKDTADIAAQKIYDTASAGGPSRSGPSPFSQAAKRPSRSPTRQSGGVRPIRAPSPLKAPAKPKTNWKGAWDASKGKSTAGKAKASKPKPKSRPVPKPGKGVRMPSGKKVGSKSKRG
ncbi:hypothetical protein NMY22_g15327 [Coprinellus aureogranulatus]|nr:hypothetical protein NMY22_g15327 [Coprinellus aureogranulatus]